MACYRVLVSVDNGMGRQHGYLQADAPLADEAPKTAQGIPAKLTLNLLAPHSAISELSSRMVKEEKAWSCGNCGAAQWAANIYCRRCGDLSKYPQGLPKHLATRAKKGEWPIDVTIYPSGASMEKLRKAPKATVKAKVI